MGCPEESPCEFFRRLRSEGVQGASGKPFGAPAGAYSLPRRGLTRRLRRGLGLAVPWGALLLRVATEGFQRASGKPFGAPAGAYSFRGPDAPTPARIGTGRPKGRSHFSFGGERKVCKRKPAARRLREKALYCPFLKEGVRNVARSTVELPTWTFVRARAHSFPLSKRARLFPSAAYRRSAPPQLAWGRLNPCRLGSFNAVRRFCSADKWAAFLFPAVDGGQAPLAG